MIECQVFVLPQMQIITEYLSWVIDLSYFYYTTQDVLYTSQLTRHVWGSSSVLPIVHLQITAAWAVRGRSLGAHKYICEDSSPSAAFTWGVSSIVRGRSGVTYDCRERS